MPDYKVTFRGDLGNLHQFDSAVRNSALSSARAIEAANTKIASSIGKITGIYDPKNSGAGLFVNKQRAIADAVNNTFKQSGEVIRRYISGYKVELDRVGNFRATPVFDNAYMGSFQKAIGNLEAYEVALKRAAASEKELLAVQKRYATASARRQNQQASAKADIESLKKIRAEGAQGSDLANALATRQVFANQLATAQQGLLNKNNVQNRKAVQQAQASLNAIDQTIKAERGIIDAEIAALQGTMAKLDRLDAAHARRAAERQRTILRRSAFQDIRAAANATPPIQADLARVLQESPELQKRLLSAGLGKGTKYGSPEFQRALAQQEAAVTNYTRNLRTNVRTVVGEFQDASGLMNKFTVDLDGQGKVIGRWGGQLSGARSILQQTVRDFQKVIEWTIATTVVFGTLATVIGQLQNINELNTALARFSITAQTSAEQTSALFRDLSQVAIATATPLNELVTVADDIALATRSANQSTEEWHSSILELTTAVGIFTNLTGKETVAAADQLSSTFKQLDIAPSGLIGVLNKVTAVAGGQANAIADIVQSVSGLAEAARAAGFTVDEQIASVQVLAQVTNKTSAEIATAFKNLFGSVSSVGSEKILKQFGIEIRDATGGLKPFLEIYREVSRALEQGIIPQNRLPDVLRGIAGGPRRAPDAAALLANIERIDEVVLKSQSATNEALVANSRVLDTNQAKIIQFQNAIDTAVFEKFGNAVRDLTGILTDFGIAFASILQGLPTDVVTLAVKFGLLGVAALTLGKGLQFLSRGLGINTIINNFRSIGSAAQATAVQVDAAATKMSAADARLAKRGLVSQGSIAKGQVFPAGLANTAKGLPLGRLAIGGAVAGATAGALAGGVDTNLIGTILQFGGTAALLSGALAPLGLAAIGVGTAIQLFAGNTQQAKEDTKDLSEEIYSLTDALKSTQQEADNFAKRQQEAAAQMTSINAETDDAVDKQQRLAAATTQYVDATLSLAIANQNVSKTFDELIGKLDEGGIKYAAFADSLSRFGVEGNPAFANLQQSLLEDILKATGGGIYAGRQIPFASQAFTGFGTGTQITPFAQGQNIAFDLQELLDNPNRLRELFGLDLNRSRATFGQAQANIPVNDISIKYLQSALAQIQEDFKNGISQFSGEEIDLLTNAILELATQTSSLAQNTAALAQSRAVTERNQALGIFTGEQARNATNAQNLIQQLLTAQGTAPRGILEDERGYANPAIQQAVELQAQLAEKAAKGQAVTNDEIARAIELYLQLSAATQGTGSLFDELAEKGNRALNEAIYQSAVNAGFSIEELSGFAKALGVDLENINQQAEDFALTFENARIAAREAFADRSLKLVSAENSGEFENNAAGLRVLQEQNQAAYNSTISLIDSIEQLSQSAFVDLANSLAQVTGLQGVYISDTELSELTTEQLAEKQAQLASRLIDAALAAGVNAEGIKEITRQVGILTGAINAIPTYKQVVINIATVGGVGFYPGSGNVQNSAVLNQVQAAIDAAKAAEKDATSEINKILDDINKTIANASGSQLGQLPSAARKAAAAAPYNKPGLLDVPEEILKSADRDKLIREAIKNARNLQAVVPGEAKENRKDIVELLNGTQRLLETRGVGEEYLRRALDELTDQIKRQNDLLTKADTIRRIRVGNGSFSAIANVPMNSISGVSVGGPGGPIDVNLNLNGTVLTPAQFQQFADLVAATIKRQIAS